MHSGASDAAILVDSIAKSDLVLNGYWLHTRTRICSKRLKQAKSNAEGMTLL